MWGGRGYGYRGGYGYGAGGYAPSGGMGCGCLSSLITTLFTMLLILVVFAAMSTSSCTSVFLDPGSGQSGATQVSTKVRTKLSSSDCTPIDAWYEDLAEWIDDPSAVTTGMQQFYRKTGVQPYLIVATNIDGEKDYDVSQVETYMRDRYDELFGNDDGHLILLFCEPYDGEYDPYLLVGSKAQSVIDTEAEDIIYDAVDNYYTDASLSNSAYFGKIFSESGDSIMAASSVTTVLTSPKKSSYFLKPVLAIAIGGVLAFVILKVMRKNQAGE